MNFPRASGILLHPTSLAGPEGIGSLGPEAFEFIDFLVRAKQTYWQMLPLVPTGWGDSPYSSPSAFAGNTLLISARALSSEFAAPGNDSMLDYGAVYEAKNRMLREVFAKNGHENDPDFETFVQDHAHWLDDYALFRAIKATHAEKAWYDWPDELKFREEHALADASATLSDEIHAQRFFQFLFFKQWNKVKSYANEKGVKIVGDVPIFVALDSADVWRHREFFKLNDDGSPRVVAGVPPDFFSNTGQLWGSPIYDWDAMQSDEFSWWIARIRHTLTMVDIARIDHFRGFGAAWEVPGGNPTAEHGEWVDAPGRELFAALKDALGDLPFWVEDLGFMTPDVEALRDDFGFPGMRILQFAFGGDARNEALPHNYVRNSIAYTGTHDNDTAVGWWQSLPEDSEARKHASKYLNTDGTEINWDMIRAIWSSVADSAITPMQDLLGLGNEARMNLPASSGDNWRWRMLPGMLDDPLTARLRDVTETYGRSPD